ALLFRPNQAPLAAVLPRTTASVGRAWRYKPFPSDVDHPGYALRIRPDTMPRGMLFRPDSGEFVWTPDDSLDGVRARFVFTLEDALGARRAYRQDIRVLADE